MRVDVVEIIAEERAAKGEVDEDPSVKLALQNFQSAMQSEDSLFDSHKTGKGPASSAGDGRSNCAGDFLLTFRDEQLRGNQGLYFQLIQKLTELLKAAGSQEVLTARLCLIPGGQQGIPAGAIALRIRLEAAGDSREQAALRWGLGLAHLQQALLFTSRYFRQVISKKSG